MLPFYDQWGEPISQETWATLKETGSYGAVGSTTVEVDGVEYWVSTVWLGIDHNFWGEGPPLIFETMAFRNGDIDDSVLVWRYPSFQTAVVGHDEVLANLAEIIRTHDDEDLETE